MGENERASRCGGAQQEAGREELSRRGSSSVSQHTTAALHRQAGRVATVLPTGKRSALPGREIASLCGFRSLREVSAAVERERRLGLPICASCAAAAPGYYMPETPEELAEYLCSLRRRLRQVGKTATALEEALAAWEGQERLKLPGEGEGRRTT